MSARKPDKTLADYVGIAIGPALIMVLVGSVVFFLLELTYRGEHALRLRWTLFWFVFASVLVTRISMADGFARASVYGMLLAWATAMMIFRFVDFVFGVIALLGFIWWCTSKLTWDCTLIDEDEDSSGKGLLAVAGFEKSRATGVAEVPRSAAPPRSADEPGTVSEPTVPRHRAHSLEAESASITRRLTKKQLRKKRKPHAPGLWVVYFSLVALPCFGIGQALFPAGDGASRDRVFTLLLYYVAAALGLLLTTSFLGLRRYLRQRYLQMPPMMAFRWLAVGSALGLAVLGASVLLPRPQAVYSLPSIVGSLGSAPPREEKRVSPSDQGRETRVEGRDGPKGEAGSGKEAGGKTAPSQPSTTPAPQAVVPPNLPLGSILKWLLYGILALVVVVLIIRHRQELLTALRELIAAVLSWFRGTTGAKTKAGVARGKENPATARSRPFRAFRNPFGSGAAARQTPDELLKYSFAALQAWAEEHGQPQRPEQTPWEFARCLAEQTPESSEEILQVTRLYVGLAYAGRTPVPESLDSLRQLWDVMERSRARHQ